MGKSQLLVCGAAIKIHLQGGMLPDRYDHPKILRNSLDKYAIPVKVLNFRINNKKMSIERFNY